MLDTTMTTEANAITVLCKCGDAITDQAVLRQQSMDLKRWNVPDYQRCEQCVAIMAAGYLRCVKTGKPFKVNGGSKK